MTKSTTDIDFFKVNLNQSIQNAQKCLEKAYKRQERSRLRLTQSMVQNPARFSMHEVRNTMGPNDTKFLPSVGSLPTLETPQGQGMRTMTNMGFSKGMTGQNTWKDIQRLSPSATQTGFPRSMSQNQDLTFLTSINVNEKKAHDASSGIYQENKTTFKGIDLNSSTDQDLSDYENRKKLRQQQRHSIDVQKLVKRHQELVAKRKSLHVKTGMGGKKLVKQIKTSNPMHKSHIEATPSDKLDEQPPNRRQMEKQRQHLLKVKLDLLTGLSNAINEAEGPAKPKQTMHTSVSATKQSPSRRSALSTTLGSQAWKNSQGKFYNRRDMERMNQTFKVGDSQDFFGGSKSTKIGLSKKSESLTQLRSVPHEIMEVEDRSVTDSNREKTAASKNLGEPTIKFTITNSGFNHLWDQATQAKIPTMKKAKGKGKNRKPTGQRNEVSLPGDLTKQYSQIIDEANKVSLNEDLEDARRTVVGLPECNTRFSNRVAAGGALHSRMQQNLNQI